MTRTRFEKLASREYRLTLKHSAENRVCRMEQVSWPSSVASGSRNKRHLLQLVHEFCIGVQRLVPVPSDVLYLIFAIVRINLQAHSHHWQGKQARYEPYNQSRAGTGACPMTCFTY